MTPSPSDLPGLFRLPLLPLFPMQLPPPSPLLPPPMLTPSQFSLRSRRSGSIGGTCFDGTRGSVNEAWSEQGFWIGMGLAPTIIPAESSNSRVGFNVLQLTFLFLTSQSETRFKHTFQAKRNVYSSCYKRGHTKNLQKKYD